MWHIYTFNVFICEYMLKIISFPIKPKLIAKISLTLKFRLWGQVLSMNIVGGESLWFMWLMAIVPLSSGSDAQVTFNCGLHALRSDSKWNMVPLAEVSRDHEFGDRDTQTSFLPQSASPWYRFPLMCREQGPMNTIRTHLFSKHLISLCNYRGVHSF